MVNLGSCPEGKLRGLNFELKGVGGVGESVSNKLSIREGRHAWEKEKEKEVTLFLTISGQRAGLRQLHG